MKLLAQRYPTAFFQGCNAHALHLVVKWLFTGEIDEDLENSFEEISPPPPEAVTNPVGLVVHSLSKKKVTKKRTTKTKPRRSHSRISHNPSADEIKTPRIRRN